MLRINKNICIKTFLVFCILFATHISANTLPFNWTDLNSLTPPSPRQFHSQTFDPSSGKIVLFGGSNNGSSLGDTWIFDVKNNSWSQLTPTSSPSPREAAMMVFDESSGLIILFGGSNNGTSLNDTWSFDILANMWTELTPPSSPSARYGGSMSFAPSNGQLILFGGYNGTTYFNDTWAFNAHDNANTWTNLTPSDPPSSRLGACMAFNPCSGQMILFGGNGLNGSLNDTWAFNANDNANTWTKLNPPTSPAARYNATMAFNSSNGLMILFGGSGNGGLLNDTWEFDAKDNANTWIEMTLSNPPPARYGAGMSFNDSSGQIILFGGSGNSGDLNDTWSLGIPSNAVLFWTNMNPSSSPPTRFSPAFAFDPCSGKIIMFGGINYSGGTYFNDTWAYDVVNNAWTELIPPMPLPSARDSARMQFDPSSGQIILFSGHGAGGYLDDTWAYDSTNNTWTEVTPTLSPSARNGGAMAYDPSSGRLILFGGYDGTNDLADMWGYDSSAITWTQITPINSPSARDTTAMAFDPASGQIILFGGYIRTSGQLLNDTWGCVYDHTANTYTWTNLNPSNPPSPRYGVYAFKFDPASGQIILFGGGDIISTFNDTWAYEGSANTWTQLSPIDPPVAREFAGFDFNPVSGQMILFGGVNLPSQFVFDDTQALGFGLSPQITSANEVTFEVGIFSSFTVTTIGFPTPAITESGTLPPGFTFVDNGNGTATLSGTPTSDSIGVDELTFTAFNVLLPNAIQPFTLLIELPLAPSNFIGVIKKNKFLNKTEYVLTAQWDPSPSPDIVYYLIYKNGSVVDEISTGESLIFKTCVNSKNSKSNYQIVAINSAGAASEPVSIRILQQ